MTQLLMYFVLVDVVVVIIAIVLYNNLVRYRVQCDNAWSQIDVQLKRRYDLIPNLVETVKGVMKFEQDTLRQVIEARSKAMGAGNLPDRLKAENEISGVLGRLLMVWEKYPELKSNQNATMLQEELTTTENKIAYCRGHYNDIAANYNAQISQIPNNIIASFANFKERAYFKVESTETQAPSVKF